MTAAEHAEIKARAADFIRHRRKRQKADVDEALREAAPTDSHDCVVEWEDHLARSMETEATAATWLHIVC